MACDIRGRSDFEWSRVVGALILPRRNTVPATDIHPLSSLLQGPSFLTFLHPSSFIRCSSRTAYLVRVMCPFDNRTASPAIEDLLPMAVICVGHETKSFLPASLSDCGI